MGPLAGVKIVELAGIGPGPMCAMLLADLGATVIRVERKVESQLGIKRPPKFNLLNRGRRQVAVDLKDPGQMHHGGPFAAVDLGESGVASMNIVNDKKTT